MISQSVPFCGLCIALIVLIATTVPLTAARVLAQSSPTTGGPVAAPTAPPAEVIPPVPTHWFSDYAKVTSPIFAIEVDRRPESLEQETTDQFVSVIFPKMQSAASINEYCLWVFNAWQADGKTVHDGCVLSVFTEEHKLRIEVSRGLKKPLTNPVFQVIIKDIAANFRSGNFEAGIKAGVDDVVKTLQTPPPRHTVP